jgi:MFS transporter, FHS family, L-fucose permease
MAILPTKTALHSKDKRAKSNVFAFSVITGLFFIWGFITCLNDILIPYLKHQFVLNYLQATLVQFAFFGAYFIGSVVYFLSSVKYCDLIEKIGYKDCIIWGLLIAAAGCLLFYPAAGFRIYGLFLGALFCLGLGFTLLQIAANPYVAILGSEESASGRLNLAQGLNSFGTTIAPLIGGYFLFSHSGTADADLGSSTIQTMYLLFAGVFIVMALVFRFIKLPAFKTETELVKGAGALKYPHLVLGILAIFTYVGGEVGVGSLLINFFKLPEIAGLTEAQGSRYVAFYWGGLMIGRFIGAVSLSTGLDRTQKKGLMILIPFVSFVAIGLLTDWTTAGFYSIFLLLTLLAFFVGASLPARTLGVFSFILVVLISTAIFTTGPIAMWCLIGAGLFNSILWSNIFALAIAGLGKYTSQGSSLLIMAILGAALLPVLQGAIADAYGLQYSFFIPVLCYAYLVFYGFLGYKAGRDKKIKSIELKLLKQ